VGHLVACHTRAIIVVDEVATSASPEATSVESSTILVEWQGAIVNVCARLRLLALPESALCQCDLVATVTIASIVIKVLPLRVAEVLARAIDAACNIGTVIDVQAIRWSLECPISLAKNLEYVADIWCPSAVPRVCRIACVTSVDDRWRLEIQNLVWV
jgi:hypothetical protein